MVTEKEFQSIIVYAKKQMEKELENNINADPRNVIWWMDDWSEITYEEWKELNKKGKKKGKEQISQYVIESFEKFWAEFPGTSKFTYNGKVFPGERVLKANKQVCLKLYNDCLEDLMAAGESKGMQLGQRCSTQILKALRVQIENIKIESYKKGDNRMQYMKSCEVYLRQRAYEAWLGESMPVEMQNVQSVSSSLDI